MRNTANMQDVAALSPDYMGFIHYKDSPRYVGGEFGISKDFPSTIRRVGVFVNEQTEYMISQLNKNHMTHVQLHGTESPETCKSLKDAGFSVIKVFSVGANFDFSVTHPYEKQVDYLMFDTKGKLFGGNAEVFDWSILNAYHQQIPFFLSGGLNAENLKSLQLLRKMNIHAVDLNSGVEDLPGMKSVEKIERVVELLNQE